MAKLVHTFPESPLGAPMEKLEAAIQDQFLARAYSLDKAEQPH